MAAVDDLGIDPVAPDAVDVDGFDRDENPDHEDERGPCESDPPLVEQFANPSETGPSAHTVRWLLQIFKST